MVSSQNTKVDLTIKAASFLGLTTYGHVMIGDKAFEFYNEKILLTLFKYLGKKSIR